MNATLMVQRSRVLAGAVSLVAAAIFAADLLTPLGVAGAVPYIICVLIAAWSAGHRFVLTVAVATSVLTLLGFALAPVGPSPSWVVATNRFLALAAIWATASLLIIYRRFQEKLQIEKQSSTLLHAISAAAIETSTVEFALQLALDQICSVTGWPVGHVWACKSNGQIIPVDLWHLEDSAKFETFRQLTQGIRLTKAVGLPGRVLTTRQLAWVADVTKDDNFPHKQLAEDVGVRGGMAIPILEGDELTYVLEFFSSEVAKPDESLRAMLTYAGRQLGQSISRRRSEEALAREQERARQYLDLVGVMVLALDLEGCILLVNRPGAAMLGYDQAELLGKNWFETCLPERLRDEVRGVFLQLVRGEVEPVEFHENPILTKDGRERLVQWHNTVLRDSSGRIIGTLGSGDDVTEQRWLEDRLRQADKMTALGQLAGGIAHDFNNQLTIILTSAEMILERLEDTQLEEQAERVVRAATHASALTRQLLSFSRRGSVQLEPVDLHQMIAEVVTLLERSIDKRIVVRKELQVDPAMILGDPSQLHNALLNLTLNARDAMPEGGELTIRTQSVGSKRAREIDPKLVEDDYLLLSVRDTGTGISAEMQKRIFEPFFTTKGVGEGTGMGLAMVHGTLEKHRGAIDVHSTPGHGTVVTLLFPVSNSVAKKEIGTARALESKSPIHILLVEDEELLRETSTEILVELGHQVVTCNDGVEALEYYSRSWQDVDLVVLDLTMPRMGGRDTLLAMCKINPKVRVLITTGFSTDGNASELLRLGAGQLINKPYRVEDFTRAIEELAWG